MAIVAALPVSVALSQASVADESRPSADGASDAAFWQTFHHGSVTVKGVRLHYVEGGAGTPVLLVPGWPESWYAWRHVMPALAASGKRVIAIDPPGTGDSDHPETGYDLKTIAEDLHAAAEALRLTQDGSVDVVGHDVGSWMSYAYAASYPGDVRRLVLLDAAIPGLSQLPPGVPDEATNLKLWHFYFNRLDDLPDILVQGHERAYLSWIFDHKMTKTWTMAPADLDEYVRAFTKPGAVRASFAYYRAAFGDEGIAQVRQWGQHKLPMPVMTIGAENGVGNLLYKTIGAVATDVRGDVAAGCGHFLAEECPEAVTADLSAFLR